MSRSGWLMNLLWHSGACFSLRGFGVVSAKPRRTHVTLCNCDGAGEPHRGLRVGRLRVAGSQSSGGKASPQKRGEACENFNPTGVLPFTALPMLTTVQGISSLVFVFVSQSA